MFDVTPRLWTTHVKVMDDVEKPDGTVRTLMRYEVAPDAAALHRA